MPSNAEKKKREQETLANTAFIAPEFVQALKTEFSKAAINSTFKGLLAPQIDNLIVKVVTLETQLKTQFGPDFSVEAVNRELSNYLNKLLGRVAGELERFAAEQEQNPDEAKLIEAGEIYGEHQRHLLRMVREIESQTDAVTDVADAFQKLVAALRQVTALQNQFKPEGPSLAELKNLKNSEEKITNSITKATAAPGAIDAALAAAKDPRAALDLNFNQTVNGAVQATTQTYPTLYHLIDEIEGLDKNSEVIALGQSASEQKPGSVANPIIDSWNKLSAEIKTAQAEIAKRVEKVFEADGLVKTLRAEVVKVEAKGAPFKGGANLSAELTTLEAAISSVKGADFPGSAAELRDKDLEKATKLLERGKFSEWIRLFNGVFPELGKLKTEVAAYPTGWPAKFEDQATYLRGLVSAAAPTRTGFTAEQAEYIKNEIDDPASRLSTDIQNQISTEGNKLSDPEFQYDRKKAELDAMGDWELVNASLTQGAKVHIEEHGQIDLSRPIEKAVYDVLKARIFTNPEIKRQESGYRSTDVDGDKKFDEWLLARGRMSLRAFMRKYVDSDAARSNVGLWKVQPSEGANELAMFAFMMYRGPLMLETYHHPVVGPMLTELMERMVVQGSLKSGTEAKVFAVRNPADGRYYPKRIKSTDPQPTQAQLD